MSTPKTMFRPFSKHILGYCQKTLRNPLTLASAIVALGVVSAQAQNTVDNFNDDDGNGNYTDGLNWDSGAVPNLSTAITAVLGSQEDPNDAVTYTPGGDLVISNGGILEVSSGSFTQVTGNNYIQLGQQGQGSGTGNGTILVNGGTFNQGTDSASPFNITGTGNAFTVTAGTANLTGNFVINPGLTFTLSGGTVNATSGETDFNAPSATMSGGALNTGLITGSNGSGTTVFNMSGGMLTLTASRFGGFYNGSPTHYINFTLNSTAEIVFAASTGDTIATADGFINSGGIELNNATTTASSFNVTQDAAGDVMVSLVSVVPEPSSIMFITLSAMGLSAWMVRRRISTSVA